jgi:two-component system response regulator HydG
MGYAWPGNIRELRNCIERLSVLADGPILTMESLPPHVVRRGRTDVVVEEAAVDLPLDEVERIHILRTLERHRWKKRRAAGVLGIDTKTLYNKLRRYGVPLEGPDGKGPGPEGGPSPRGVPSP